jgi:glutamine synthetase
MSSLRFQALNAVLTRTIPDVKQPSTKISEFFGANVFSKKTMKEYLSKEAYQSVITSIDLGAPINRDIAEQVAAAMKAWAIGKSVTHYTHWFQPLTGSTAEKHDS